MNNLLLLGGSVYAQGIPDAQALLISDGAIAWIGDRDTALSLQSKSDHVVDLADAFIAPGFVDAHVHLSATGMNIVGNVSEATSFAHLAHLVNEVESNSEITFLHGWDDSSWNDTVADFSQQLNISKIHNLYLTRVDAHSAIVVRSDVNHGVPTIVSGQDHEDIRRHFLQQITPEQRQTFISSALQHAASQGIVSVHENGGPVVSSVQDLSDAMLLGQSHEFPDVVGYWGDGNVSEAVTLGAFGAAGDYSVDGSLGSHTALLKEPYVDLPTSTGNAYLDVTEISEHIVACTEAGIQAGFHVIGDEAISRVAQAFRKASEKVPTAKMRACRHRLEHVEMPSVEDLKAFADVGVVLSVQPVFDEIWGIPGGMYEQRLGMERASLMNPFALMLNQGLTIAFGSDSPVTPMNPWRTIRAAIEHNQHESRISARSAFTAHTRGGWRAVRRDDAGVIAVGAPAHLAVWDAKQFLVDVPDERRARWSTDVRSGVHALPDVRHEIPQCVAAMKSGQAIYDPNSLFQSVGQPS